MVSFGTLAAGTAHEISTPLSNIGMMADELQNSPDDIELVRDFAHSIKQQQQHCVEQLQVLRSASEQARQSSMASIKLQDFLKNTLDRWAAMRPEIKLSRSINLNQDPVINDDLTIPIVQQDHHRVGDGVILNKYLSQHYSYDRDISLFNRFRSYRRRKYAQANDRRG